MTPDQYHRILVALDVVLESFEDPLAVLSSDDARVRYELQVIRSKILKAESGHPFPFGAPESETQSEASSADAQRVAEEAPERRSPESRRIRALVVDDQESVRTVVRLLLEAESDIEVVGVACNGRDGIDMADLYRPDVILLDVNMPVLDGFAAAKQILESYPSTKIIIFSANRSDEYLEKARQIGVAAYLAKPASRTQLITAVREAYSATVRRIGVASATGN